jgi:hypothetical protein
MSKGLVKIEDKNHEKATAHSYLSAKHEQYMHGSLL